MQIRIRETGQVMYLDEFRRIQKELGTPYWYDINEQNITDYAVDVIFEGPQATGGTVYQYSQRQGVEQQSDGKWYTKYVLGPIFYEYTKEDGTVITAAEAEAAYKAQKDAEQGENVRYTRNQRLIACDWTQCKDIPDSVSQPWATYRQALRDVPLQTGFPWTIEWPAKPE